MNFTVWMNRDTFAALSAQIIGRTEQLSVKCGDFTLCSDLHEFKGATMSPDGRILVEFAPVVESTPHVNEVAAAGQTGQTGTH